MLFVCSFLAAALMMTGTALAGPAPSPSGDQCTKLKNGVLKCEYVGDDVWAQLVTHKGTFIGGNVRPVFISLIDYRIDFLPELNKTVEEL